MEKNCRRNLLTETKNTQSLAMVNFPNLKLNQK